MRYFHIDARSDWQLSGAINSFPASSSVPRSTDLWDPIVGVRGRVRWGEGAGSPEYYLDVGTGSSEVTWQSLIGIGHGFKWGDLVLAYRTIFYDQSNDKLLQDFRFSGTTLGAWFRF